MLSKLNFISKLLQVECIYFPITEVVCWIQVAHKITCRKLITPERLQLDFHSKLTGSEKVAIHSTIFDLERTQTPRETSYRRQVTPTNQLSLPIFLKPAPFTLFHKYMRKMSATQARLLLTKYLCLKDFLQKSCFSIKLFEIVSSNWNFWPPALLNPTTGPHTLRKQNPPTPPPIHAYSPPPSSQASCPPIPQLPIASHPDDPPCCLPIPSNLNTIAPICRPA